MLSGFLSIVLLMAANDGIYATLFILIVVLLILIYLTARTNTRLRNENAVAVNEVQQVRAQQANASSSRDDVMFDQHRQMNELTINKLKAEAEWMAAQTAARAKDQLRDEAWLEYHELMVEKAKLEIDSLRLYIQEQRKRLNDDWNH